MELHMSFLGSPCFPSDPEPTEVLVYVEKRFAFAVMLGYFRTGSIGERGRGEGSNVRSGRDGRTDR